MVSLLRLARLKREADQREAGKRAYSRDHSLRKDQQKVLPGPQAIVRAGRAQNTRELASGAQRPLRGARETPFSCPLTLGEAACPPCLRRGRIEAPALWGPAWPSASNRTPHTAFDAGEAEGAHFLVMEYVDGKDLAHVLLECGDLSPLCCGEDELLCRTCGGAWERNSGLKRVQGVKKSGNKLPHSKTRPR